MSISKGTFAMPRLVESLRQLYVGNVICTVLDGNRFVGNTTDGSQGDIVADFVHNAIPDVPHGVVGRIVFWDGQAKPVLDIQGARMQFELGRKVGPWTAIDAFFATGISTGDVYFVFRSVGVDPGDDTSLIVEFAAGDAPGVKGLIEAAAWAGVK